MSEEKQPLNLNPIDPPDNTGGEEEPAPAPTSPAPDAKPIDPPDNTKVGS